MSLTGATVFGKYAVSHRLAVGGMSEVYFATDGSRPVVLKVLLPELARQDGFVQQFLDEAKLAARLDHPNVVALAEVGVWDGAYVIAMEYVHGRDVADVLRLSHAQGRSVPVPVALRIAADVAAGLGHAHGLKDETGAPLNVVHRDMSPQNVMVREDGVAKVVDFGIARASNRSTRTATGVIKGKLAYMAPEQVQGAALTGHTDQFALGLVLWELLTGRRAYRADGDIALLKLVLEADLPPPSHWRKDVPAKVDALVARLLAKLPAGRFPSCGAAAEALEALVAANARQQVADYLTSLGTEDLAKRTRPPAPQLSNVVIAVGKGAAPRPSGSHAAARTEELVTPQARSAAGSSPGAPRPSAPQSGQHTPAPRPSTPTAFGASQVSSPPLEATLSTPAPAASAPSSRRASHTDSSSADPLRTPAAPSDTLLRTPSPSAHRNPAAAEGPLRTPATPSDAPLRTPAPSPSAPSTHRPSHARANSAETPQRASAPPPEPPVAPPSRPASVSAASLQASSNPAARASTNSGPATPPPDAPLQTPVDIGHPTRWLDFENAGTYVNAIATELVAAGMMPALLARVGPLVREGLEQPLSRKWWPGAVIGESNELVVARFGAPALERVVLAALNNRMGVVVGPLVKVTVSLSGMKPGTLFAGAPRVFAAGVRGLTVDWTADGASGGLFRIGYPSPVTASFVAHFRAIAHYILSLAQRKGEVKGALSADHRAVELHVRWP